MTRRGEKQPRKQVGNLADPQGMAVHLQKFLDWLRVKNYTERTVISRETYINLFIEWAEERGLTRPTEITKPILERYQRYMYHYCKSTGEPLTFRSQHNRLSALRSWFKWLTK